jgi:hypothetical protein
MGEHDRGQFDRERLIEMNLAFARAMLRARRCGDEQFSIGVVKDHTPMVPVYYPREPRLSLMSSSAQDCAESGMAESLPDSFMVGPTYSRKRVL